MKLTASVKKGDIIVGSPLQHDVYNEDGELLLKKNQIIETQRQLEILIKRGLFFKTDMDTSRSTERSEVKEKQHTPFELLDNIYDELSGLYNSLGEKNFSSKILDICKRIQLSCQINEDASLGTILLNRDWWYPVSHQIHCALLCEILLSHLGGSPENRLSLLAAGLTMNIGMIDLQETLYNQKERLNDKIRNEVKTHPVSGIKLLQKHGVNDGNWLTIVQQHHELMDGSGYPQGLKGDEIDYNARLLTLADIYSTKMSPRAYRDPLPPHIAAREVFTGDRGQCFDQELTRIFLKRFGMFHPGSFVRLANGETALVTYRGLKIDQPKVKSVSRADGRPLLSPAFRDCSEEDYKIIGYIAPQKVNISINKMLVWGYWGGE